MDAYIVRHTLPSTSLLVKINIKKKYSILFFFFQKVISPITVDTNNNTVIIITQPDIDTKINSTNQLIVSLMLRYALECAKGCQHHLKESIFTKIFHSLQLPIDICK